MLVNVEGTPLYCRQVAKLLPVLACLRTRRGPARWAIRVRHSPWRGSIDLAHETYADLARARQREHDLADQITRGRRFWPLEYER